MRDSPEAFAAPPMDVMDCFPAALVQLRDNGQIAHSNLAWAALMGPHGAERNLMDYVHQEDRPLWRQALNELRRRPDTSFNQRLRFVHPSGELRWFDISLKRGPQGFYLVAGDVTAHKRREIALQASQRSSMSLLDSMPGLIYRGRNNRDWTMEFVSAGCLQLTGYPAERLVDNHEFTYNSLILAQDADYVWRECNTRCHGRSRSSSITRFAARISRSSRCGRRAWGSMPIPAKCWGSRERFSSARVDG